MCGFCGVIGPAERAAVEDIESMAQTLVHRGPDDFGTWIDRFRGKGGEQAIGLGHTRLSILDLSQRGHQPMVSSDGSLVVVYNGEIYNFDELRGELKARGHNFVSATDTEVLLEAWRAWGIRALERLNGMFAFALWDTSRRELLLARDRIGIKPLYWGLNEGVLTFGSELRALRRHRSFQPQIDPTGLSQFLQYGYLVGEQSIYRNTARVRPGGWLTWRAGRIQTGTYWRITDPSERETPRSFVDAVDELEELLKSAVERRLVADVPLGAFLSGGVDSSAVVALMQEQCRTPVRTFSIGFRDPRYDEAPFARGVAAYLGTEHTELYVDHRDAVETARSLADLYDEPFADRSAIPTLLLSRLTRKSVTVSLSGDGGDELFGGYPLYQRFDQLMRWLRLPSLLRRGALAVAPIVPWPHLRNGLRHLARGEAWAVAANMRCALEPELVASACGGEVRWAGGLFEEMFRGAPTDDEVARFMYAEAGTYLPDDILTKLDRASMSVGLEARVPMLDHEVVRFALSLPRQFFWHEGHTKAPLKEVLYRRVPRELIERPKQGFSVPWRELLGQELDSWIRYYLEPDRLVEEGHFTPEGARALRSAALRRRGPLRLGLWHLLCFERWFARTHRGERAA